jgi:hypothetical protein
LLVIPFLLLSFLVSSVRVLSFPVIYLVSFVVVFACPLSLSYAYDCNSTTGNLVTSAAKCAATFATKHEWSCLCLVFVLVSCVVLSCRCVVVVLSWCCLGFGLGVVLVLVLVLSYISLPFCFCLSYRLCLRCCRYLLNCVICCVCIVLTFSLSSLSDFSFSFVFCDVSFLPCCYCLCRVSFSFFSSCDVSWL